MRAREMRYCARIQAYVSLRGREMQPANIEGLNIWTLQTFFEQFVGPFEMRVQDECKAGSFQEHQGVGF